MGSASSDVRGPNRGVSGVLELSTMYRGSRRIFVTLSLTLGAAFVCFHNINTVATADAPAAAPAVGSASASSVSAMPMSATPVSAMSANQNAGAAANQSPTTPAAASSAQPAPNPLKADLRPYILHLPGIGGYMNIDRAMIWGLHDGGVKADVDVYDWTEGDPGMDALTAHDRNRAEAQIIADKIALRAKLRPNEPITITCHSGGCAMAAWALEKLPQDVQVQDVFMMSAALSPKYDLSAALHRVVGHLYVFSSQRDVLVLGTGTKMFGTMDGVKGDAAGRVGFTMPATGDPNQYAKVVPCPYQDKWMALGDIGDHIGAMNRDFAAAVLAPMILDGLNGGAPADPVMPATQPSR
jgi:hypothetical protein